MAAPPGDGFVLPPPIIVPPPLLQPPPGFTVSSGADNEEAEKLNQRMMTLVMKLTHPEKDRQSRQPLILLPPRRTLYINNLNEKVPLIKLENDLKELFNRFGRIIDFLALKSFWRRGQAFITFEKQEEATAALNALQNHMYEGKPLRVNYARKDSTAIDEARKEEAKLAKQNKQPDSVIKKPYSIVQREKLLQEEFMQLQQDILDYQQSLAVSIEDRGKRKAFSLSLSKSSESKRAKTDDSLAHRILFCDQLAPEIAEGDLISTFGGFQGFEKVRFIEAKRVAFIDFRTVEAATAALESLDNESRFKVSYAKR